MVCNNVAELAVRKQIVSDVGQGITVHYGGRYVLQNRDQDHVREIIWNLIVEGVLTIGTNSSNTEWPWLKLTEYGHSMVNSEMPAPHDPSGYLARLRNDIPNIDPVIIIYLIETLKTYNINLVLSSSIMLGCASEKALSLLIDAFINSHTDPTRKKTVTEKFNNKTIKRQFDEFIRSLTTIKDEIPKDIRDGLNNVLLGVFEMIRSYRNDAGHPTGKTIIKEQVFANIQVFIPYLKKVYQLIEYFESR
jgi:hypothetical protein